MLIPLLRGLTRLFPLLVVASACGPTLYEEDQTIGSSSSEDELTLCLDYLDSYPRSELEAQCRELAAESPALQECSRARSRCLVDLQEIPPLCTIADESALLFPDCPDLLVADFDTCLRATMDRFGEAVSLMTCTSGLPEMPPLDGIPECAPLLSSCPNALEGRST